MLAQAAERRRHARLDPADVGSVTATDPVPELFATHAYAAAKGAIVRPDDDDGRDLRRGPDPGQRRGPVADRARRWPPRAAGDDRASVAFAARKQPLAGEMLDPDEVAHAAVYFLSDESRVVTGQILDDRRRLVGRCPYRPRKRRP